MTTKIGEIAGKHYHSILELREFAAPDGTLGLQITPMGAVFVQMSPDDVQRLCAVLLTWAESRTRTVPPCNCAYSGYGSFDKDCEKQPCPYKLP